LNAGSIRRVSIGKNVLVLPYVGVRSEKNFVATIFGERLCAS
jgi:hypothetical protein